MTSMEIVSFDAAQREVIREQICPGISDPELSHFEQVCAHTGLSPFTSPPQIYVTMRSPGGGKPKKMVVQAGIDGMCNAAARTGAWAGADEPSFEYGDDGAVVKATATVYRMVQGVRCPFTGVARMAEYRPPSGQDRMWTKMPHGQLAKCARAQAIRLAFPLELGGVYSTEEMAQAGPGGDAVDAGTPAGQITEDQRVAAVERAVDAGYGRPAASRWASTLSPADYEGRMLKMQQTIDEKAEADTIDVDPATVTEDANDEAQGESDAA